MTGIVLALVLVGIAAGGLIWFARAGRALLDQRLGGMEEKLDRRLGDVETKVDRRLDGLDGRLLSQQQSAGQPRPSLPRSSARWTRRPSSFTSGWATFVGSSRHSARPRRAAGSASSSSETSFRDILPPDAYALQYGFRSGERVDAVVRVDKLIPIDAKFPLDNFERLVNAEDDVERAAAQKLFTRDVKGHADAIAAKYIRPGEGNVRLRLHVRACRVRLLRSHVWLEADCSAYASTKHVFPVSPTTFHAYLQVIAIGLKGLQIEQHAKDVMAYSPGSPRTSSASVPSSTPSASSSASRSRTMPKVTASSRSSRSTWSGQRNGSTRSTRPSR